MLPQGRAFDATRAGDVPEPAVPPPETFPSGPYLSPLLFFRMPLPTVEEVASYFAEALGETPAVDGHQRLRFERWLVFVWGTSWRRCVLSGGARGVTLDWWTNDDFGLSELREFFEAPFFKRGESIRFYQWLGEGGAHETDFRGHRLRMVVRRRDGVLFVRIQWWAPGADADGSNGLLNVPGRAATPLAMAPGTEFGSGGLFATASGAGMDFGRPAAPPARMHAHTKQPSTGNRRPENAPGNG